MSFDPPDALKIIQGFRKSENRVVLKITVQYTTSSIYHKRQQEVRAYSHLQSTDLGLPKIVHGWSFESVWCHRIITFLKRERGREGEQARENF